MSTTTTRKDEPTEIKIYPMITHIRKPPPELPGYQRLKVFTEDYRLEYDYADLLSQDKTIIQLCNKPCKLNIIISAYKRDLHLKACIKALEYSIRESDLLINITIVQIEDIPTLQEYANLKQFDYIFLHIDDINTNGMFSKALAYDIAYLLSNPSEVTLLHDNDLIVTDNFFSIIDKHYLEKLTWIQAFTNKCVVPIHYEDSLEILNNNIPNNELTTFLDAKNPYLNIPRKNIKTDNFPVTTVGACGGSILVTNELYEQVGGMDPEICYGYGVEDALFWTKLVTIMKKLNRVNSVHQTDHQYADEPPLYQYHLYHVTLTTSNPLYRKMTDMQMEFLRSRHTDKSSYVDMKRKQFAQQKEKVLEYRYDN